MPAGSFSVSVERVSTVGPPQNPELLPLRGSAATELCGACHAPTSSHCERCELPLCDDHLPSDTVACIGCQAYCSVCRAVVLRNRRCRRCRRFLCWRHRPILRKWCRRCATEWRQTPEGANATTRARVAYGIVVGSGLVFGALGLTAGLTMGLAGLLGAPLGFLPYAFAYDRLAAYRSRRRFLTEGRKAAELEEANALALPDGHADDRDQS